MPQAPLPKELESSVVRSTPYEHNGAGQSSNTRQVTDRDRLLYNDSQTEGQASQQSKKTQ